MSTTTVKLDDDLKKEASRRLKTLGLSFNSYVTLATKQLIIQNRVPFSIELPLPVDYSVPSSETSAAMKRAERWSGGESIEGDSPAFTDVDKLFAELDRESA